MPPKPRQVPDELERFNATLQRIIGLVLAAIFVAAAAVNFATLLLAPDRLSTTPLLVYFAGVLIPAALFMATGVLTRQPPWRVVQAVTLIAAGVFGVTLGNTVSLWWYEQINLLMSEMLLVFGYVVLAQFNHRHPLVNRVVAAVLMTYNAVILVGQNLNLSGIGVTYSVFLGVLLVFFDWVLAQKFRFFEQGKLVAERERASLATFARLGLAVNSITHDVKGRLALQRGLLGRLRLPDSKVLTTEQASRFHESYRLLEKSLGEMEGFTGGLTARFDGTAEHQAFDLRELVRDLVSSTNLALGVSIRADVPDAPVRWEGTPYPVIQILENLVRNGLEATVPPPSVDVSLRTDAEGATLTVRNDGPPLIPCQTCLFDHRCREQPCKTFVLGKTTKDGGSGTGMVTVIGTVKRLRGNLTVTSDERLTSFVVTLPAG